MYRTVPPAGGSEVGVALSPTVSGFVACGIAGIAVPKFDVLVCLICVPEAICWIGCSRVDAAVVPVIANV